MTIFGEGGVEKDDFDDILQNSGEMTEYQLYSHGQIDIFGSRPRIRLTTNEMSVLDGMHRVCPSGKLYIDDRYDDLVTYEVTEPAEVKNYLEQIKDFMVTKRKHAELAREYYDATVDRKSEIAKEIDKTNRELERKRRQR
jgi:hypothetical protein